jgi:hypothetical protein
MDEDRFARLMHRLQERRVAAPTDMVGCGEDQIEALEARYGIRLPPTYRRYLEVMGHRAGRLFSWDHAAVFYQHVLSMTAELRREWEEAWTTERDGPPPEFELPADALVIYGRLGDQFQFIRCDGQDDPPVFYFNTWEWEVLENAPSVMTWLENWCAGAEDAIAEGYFEHYPDGTTP